MKRTTRQNPSSSSTRKTKSPIQKAVTPKDNQEFEGTLKNHFFAVILLSLLSILVYINSLGNQFVHDDNYQIVRNPFLHSDQPWSHLFTTDVWGYTAPGQHGISNYYRPLQMLTYRWTAELAGLDPRAFHSVSVLLHLLATLAAYAVFWGLTRQLIMAFLSSALFAVHPIHTEAVAWISALPELGCAFFFFLSFSLFLLAYRRFDVGPGKMKSGENSQGLSSRKHGLWAGSLLCFALATLWKEMALTLPLVIALYVFIFSKKPSSLAVHLWEAIRTSFPYWGMIALYLVLRYKVLGFLTRTQQDWDLTPFEFILSVAHIFGKYWLKLVWPVQLNAFYLFEPVRSLGEPRVLVALAFLGRATVFLFGGLERAPLACGGGFWVFTTLIPVMNLRGVGANVFTERYLYIPSLGFCLLMIWLGKQGLKLLPVQRRRWLAIIVLTAVVTLYFGQTIRRNRDWKDDFTFYSLAAETSPKSAAMHNSLANILRSEKGDLEGSERECRLAITLANQERPPDRRQIASAYLGLANIHVECQQYQKALEAADSGLATENSLPGLSIVRGLALMSLGRLDEAENVLLSVNHTLPNDELVLHFLGVIALSRRDMEQAINYFQGALKILPDYADAHNNLAAAYVELGRFTEALPHLQRASSLRPQDPSIHTNVGMALVRLGRTQEARTEFQRALALSPDYSPARAELTQLDRH